MTMGLISRSSEEELSSLSLEEESISESELAESGGEKLFMGSTSKSEQGSSSSISLHLFLG